MQIQVSKTPSDNVFVKASAMLFTGLILIITATAFLSFFSNVRTTIDVEGTWLYLYIVVLLTLLTSMMVSLIGNKAKFHIEGGVIKKTGLVLAGLLGFSVLTSFSIFSGIPTALHYVESSNGEINVTVSKKDDSYDKRRCSPRLIIQEFTFFSSDFICPGDEAYKAISVGDTITVIGTISKYGVEAKKIQWLTKPSN